MKVNDNETLRAPCFKIRSLEFILHLLIEPLSEIFGHLDNGADVAKLHLAYLIVGIAEEDRFRQLYTGQNAPCAGHLITIGDYAKLADLPGSSRDDLEKGILGSL